MRKHAANREDVRGKIVLTVFIVVYFVCLCRLSWHYPLEQGFFPDEKGRISLPMFFYEHGTLPTGYEESVRMSPWGFSYASYPLMLSSLVGGILMKLAGLITDNMNVIVMAARMVSITSGTIFAFFVIKISKLLFDSPVRYLFSSMIVLLPQVIFLSLYFNNDIVALMGSSIVLYAWLLAIRKSWNAVNAVLLAVGVAIVALSYYNAYSWILSSMVVYFAVWIRDAGSFGALWENRRFLRVTCLAIAIALVAILPFFIRAAIINHGDFLGLSTITRMSSQYGEETFKPANRPTPQHLGMGLWEMLVSDHYLTNGNNWLKYTFFSFVGVFGPMSVFLPRFVYWLYALFFAIGIFGFCLHRIRLMKNHEYGVTKYMDMAMLVNIVIVVALALWYSYATDYQAQGRYVLPMILAFAYIVVSGWKHAMDCVLSSERSRFAFCGIIVGMMSCVVLFAFMVYYVQG